MGARRWLLALIAVSLIDACGGTKPPARAPTSMQEEVAQVRAGGHVRARSGAAPCAADDEAGCERLCQAGNGWACATAADAHVARGDARGAAPLYIAACERRDPFGCIGASRHVARDRALAPSFPMRHPIGSVALMIVACERIPALAPGTEQPNASAGPNTVTAEVNGGLCPWMVVTEWLDDHKTCLISRDPSACQRERDTKSVAAAERDAEAAAAAAAAEQAEAAAHAETAEVDRKYREAKREEEELALAQGRERVRVAREELRAKPAEGPGRLSRTDCEHIVIEACERWKVQGRRNGIAEKDIESAAQQCREGNRGLVTFCEGVRCGPRWKRCMVDQSVTPDEWNACERFAFDC